MLTKVILSLSAIALTQAQLIPTGPTPGDTFREGTQCLVQFNPDTEANSPWTNATISLMSGSNFDMVKVVDIVTNYDGTAGAGRISFDCPEVTPNSEIYFYQFYAPGADYSWTGRFTIAGANGETTEPTNSTTTGGTTIEYGFGALTDPSQTNTPLVSGGSAGAGSGSPSAGASASSAMSGMSLATMPSMSTSAAASSTSSSSAEASTSSAPSSSEPASSSAGPSSASPAVEQNTPSSSPTSGASKQQVVTAGMAVVVALALTVLV